MTNIPSYQDFMLPLLKLFAEGDKKVSECIPSLISEFSISKEDEEKLLPSGKMTYLYNRAHWARTYLGKAGLLESPKRGMHRITAKGRTFLAKNPAELNNKVLGTFDAFSEWRETSSNDNGSPDTKPNSEAFAFENGQTPEDAMLSASKLLSTALRDDLLAALMEVSPTRFERLILDLLGAMGFGGGTTGYSHLTPASGDGGIDGIINEDALGLDAVYIQAKRYSPDNKVSRPDIQRFVGSLTGESATKGVFVTTSSFSKEARAYIERVQQRVVLIDGKQLSDLMISHNVGVRIQTTYELKSIDEQYFTEG
jgi:restriction system protein